MKNPIIMLLALWALVALAVLLVVSWQNQPSPTGGKGFSLTVATLDGSPQTSFETAPPPIEPMWMSKFPRLKTLLDCLGKSAESLEALGEPEYTGRASKGDPLTPGFGNPFHRYWWTVKTQDYSPSSRQAFSITIELSAAVGEVSAVVEAVEFRLKGPPLGRENLPTLPEIVEYLALDESSAELSYLLGNESLGEEHWFYFLNRGDGRAVLLGGPYQGSPVRVSKETDFSSGKTTTTVSRAADFSLAKVRLKRVYVGPEEYPFGGAGQKSLITSLFAPPAPLPER